MGKEIFKEACILLLLLRDLIDYQPLQIQRHTKFYLPDTLSVREMSLL